MKKILFAMAAVLMALGSTATTARAQGILTGDTRYACEAIMCLASGNRPEECSPSLRRYFSIQHRRLRDTHRARTNFLQLCPTSNQTPEMASLVSAEVNSSGRCDAQSLNLVTVRWDGSSNTFISDQMPDYCTTLTNHAYTGNTFNGTVPRYVGMPERGGYWLEARDYERALAEYTERVRREDEERQRQSWMN